MKKLIYLFGFFWVTAAQAQTLSTHKTAVVHSRFRVAGATEALASDTAKALMTIDYHDGLGRAEQTIAYRQSPAGKDIIINHTDRDNYGRNLRVYLPVPTTESSGEYKTGVQVASMAFYGDNRAFGSPKGNGLPSGFDDSPLNRQLITYGPGQAWADEDKSTMVTYTTADLEFRGLFELNAAGDIVRNLNYPLGSLFKKVTTDEQGNNRTEITDRQGRIIRSQSGNGFDKATTYYVYDDHGRQAAVMQPEGIGLQASQIIKDSDNWKKYVFAYEYDARNRVIRKHIPGAGWTEYVYDKADRPVLQRDSVQKTANLWTFTKYDAFDRIAITGEYEIANDRSTLQSIFDSYIDDPNEHWKGAEGYDGLSYPSGLNPGSGVGQFFFYDQYDFVTTLNSNMAFKSSGAYHAVHSSAKGLPTGYLKYNLDSAGVYYMTTLYYDDKNRLIQQQSTHPKTTNPQPDRTDYEYNFAGEVLREKRIYKTISKADQTLITRHSYDHAGRLIKTYLSLNGQPEKEIIKYSYDEIGRLIQKIFIPNENFVLGNPDYIYRPPNPGINQQDLAKKAIVLEPGTVINADSLETYLAQIDSTSSSPFTGLQTMNYQWHIRGGMKGINLNASESPLPDMTKGDLFSYKLDYETAGQWNGNIGKQSWNHVGGANPVGIRDYTYSYDTRNQLKSALFSGLTGENYSVSGLNYDRNGNINSLKRYGNKGDSFGLMDDLTYSYSGNRLTKVTDTVSGDFEIDFVQKGSGNYTYYENGALKSDDNEQIANIVYNTFLNQPELITLTDGRWIKHTYLGSGELVKTEYSNGEIWEFNNGLIFKNGEFYSLAIPEGRAVFNGGNWQYEFDYKDHLGNTRVSFKADGSTLVQTAKTDMDPWGVVLKGTGLENSFQNRFEFQGKETEKTFGLNRINFGARSYNPTIGRFDKTDILSEKMPNMATYSYNFNNPLSFIDFDGRIPYPITIRAFAPFKTFGYGFHGDNRGYSTANVSARVHQRINFDTDKTSISTTAWSSPTWNTLNPNNSSRATPSVRFTDNYKIKRAGDSKAFEFGTHVAAGNPLTPPGTPNIDIFSDFSIVENKKAGTLSISGSLKGDNFPSTEAFITDPRGNNVFIGIGQIDENVGKNTGPFIKLWGQNKRREISSFNFTINTDENGNFTGVSMGGTNYSLDDWNKRFTSETAQKQ